MKLLGEDVAEQLEYVSASFRVIRHVCPKFACSCCDHIAHVAASSRPIERGLAGPWLLAHVLVSKFADHLLLYRKLVPSTVFLVWPRLATLVPTKRNGGRNSGHTDRFEADQAAELLG